MSYDDFIVWLTKLDLSTIDANPITFNLTDFKNDLDFTKSMFLAGRHLVNEEDIAVRYSKPYNEDKTDVTVRFQIVRSKAKMFNNFLKNNDTKIVCYLGSNKEIKEAMKFFNSLGVKGEDMLSLSSKDNDYASILKDGLEEYNKYKEMMGEELANSVLVTISIEHDTNSDVDYPMLTYDFVNTSAPSNFNCTKEWIKMTILKIN